MGGLAAITFSGQSSPLFFIWKTNSTIVPPITSETQESDKGHWHISIFKEGSWQCTDMFKGRKFSGPAILPRWDIRSTIIMYLCCSISHLLCYYLKEVWIGEIHGKYWSIAGTLLVFSYARSFLYCHDTLVIDKL